MCSRDPYCLVILVFFYHLMPKATCARYVAAQLVVTFFPPILKQCVKSSMGSLFLPYQTTTATVAKWGGGPTSS